MEARWADVEALHVGSSLSQTHGSAERSMCDDEYIVIVECRDVVMVLEWALSEERTPQIVL